MKKLLNKILLVIAFIIVVNIIPTVVNAVDYTQTVNGQVTTGTVNISGLHTGTTADPFQIGDTIKVSGTAYCKGAGCYQSIINATIRRADHRWEEASPSRPWVDFYKYLYSTVNIITGFNQNTVSVGDYRFYSGYSSSNYYNLHGETLFTVPFIPGNYEMYFGVFNNSIGGAADSHLSIPFTVSCIDGTVWDGSKCATIKAPSGSISAKDCTIALNASTCHSSVSWSSSDIVSGSSFAVTHNNPDNSSISSLKSDTKNVSITNGFTDFYIYNSDVELASATVTASCVSGSSWEGTSKTCKVSTVTPITVSISANPAGPLTATGTTALTWTTTNSPSSCTASNSWSGSKTSSGGSESRTGMTAGTYHFDVTCSKTGLSDANDSVTVVVNDPTSTGTWSYLTPCPTACETAQSTQTQTCTGGNGSCSETAGTRICKATAQCPETLTGTLTGDDCTIALGGSTCTTKLTLNIINPVAGAATNITKAGNVQVASGITPVAKTNIVVNYPNTIFYLNHNGNTLNSKIVTASCGTNVWDGTKCVSSPLTTGTLSATNCTITTAGASTCVSKLTWTTSNLIAGKATAVTRDNPANNSVSTATSGTNVSNTINYGSSTYYLYHNGAEPPLATKSVTASCDATKLTWDTVNGKCVTTTPTVGTCFDGIQNQNETSVDYGGVCAIDGKWSDPNCPTECNTPASTITRTCTNPAPSKGGKDCQGDTSYLCSATDACPSGEILNIKFTANPTTIWKGGSSTLKWTSDATECFSVPKTGDGSFNTNGSINGSVKVYPKITSTYKIQCTKESISEPKTTEVKVTSINIIES